MDDIGLRRSLLGPFSLTDDAIASRRGPLLVGRLLIDDRLVPVLLYLPLFSFLVEGIYLLLLVHHL